LLLQLSRIQTRCATLQAELATTRKSHEGALHAVQHQLQGVTAEKEQLTVQLATLNSTVSELTMQNSTLKQVACLLCKVMIGKCLQTQRAIDGHRSCKRSKKR